ncbi:MAG TPA: tRNA pseudouridine(55) synthase TruB [Tepidisphaeraceae bacterium]|jgi:tRNA pseudouridine55 synthase
MNGPAVPVEGVINLNKPRGISSARAVGIVKRKLPRNTKIGHAGTLDPFATGVLLLLIGKATKCCELLMDQPKQYLTMVKLGATTPTDDPESPETPTPGIEPVATERVEEAIQTFVGEILQRPPAFSAMKIGGRRAYDIARRGGEVELKPRPVKIYSIELIEYAWPFVKLRIDCGRGAYIRAIARDLGEMLGCGGHLTELARTRVGDYTIENAVTLEQIAEGAIESRLTPVPGASA